MQSMFSKCTSLLSLNIDEFNLSSVNNLIYLFDNCYSLVSLNLSNFNFETNDFYGMFIGFNPKFEYCIDDKKTYKFLDLLSKYEKNCTDICINWNLKKYIINENLCIDDCGAKGQYYEFNNICYDYMILGSVSIHEKAYRVDPRTTDILSEIEYSSNTNNISEINVSNSSHYITTTDYLFTSDNTSTSHNTNATNYIGSTGYISATEDLSKKDYISDIDYSTAIDYKSDLDFQANIIPTDYPRDIDNLDYITTDYISTNVYSSDKDYISTTEYSSSLDYIRTTDFSKDIDYTDITDYTTTNYINDNSNVIDYKNNIAYLSDKNIIESDPYYLSSTNLITTTDIENSNENKTKVQFNDKIISFEITIGIITSVIVVIIVIIIIISIQKKKYIA